ncbi:MAG: hypothetical protein MZU79_09335 [Anaerotruncus sp.]|nr:hypothetical protein [Anaerotruncus sp.]
MPIRSGSRSRWGQSRSVPGPSVSKWTCSGSRSGRWIRPSRLSEIEGKIAEADGALRKIGAVNMLAIEEYEKVQRQVGERTERKETLSSERDDA